jgi:ribosomal protein L7Ae-like RNA K-turn-binding protein
MDKILGFLGMCKKAGALEAGDEAVYAAVRSGSRKRRAALILTASDAAGNTVRRAENLSKWSNTELAVLPYTKEQLGEMLGKRVSAVIVITDLNMAASFLKKLSAGYEEYSELYMRLKAKQIRRAGIGGLAAKTQDKSKRGGM